MDAGADHGPQPPQHVLAHLRPLRQDGRHDQGPERPDVPQQQPEHASRHLHRGGQGLLPHPHTVPTYRDGIAVASRNWQRFNYIGPDLPGQCAGFQLFRAWKK